MIQSANDAIFIADTETGLLLDANQRAEALLGLPIEKIVGMHQTQLHPPEEAERYRAIFNTYIQTGGVSTEELYVCHRDGRRIPVEISASVFRIGDKQFIQGIFRDVTERKQAEQARRESAEQYQTLFETTPVGLGVADLNGNLLTFNDAILRPGGYTRADMLALGNVAQLYFDPAQRNQVLTLVRNQGRLDQYPVKFKRKDGTPYDALLTLIPLQFKGKPGWQAVVEDVTARRVVEKALSESEAQLAGIIDSAMDAIITIDDDQRITRFNAAAERMFRCSATVAIGQPLHRLMPERFRAGHREHVDGFGAAQRTKRAIGNLGILTGLRADGAEFPIEVAISQIQVGGKIFFTAIIRDVTERQHAEGELRRRANEFAALYDITRDLAAQQDVPTLLQMIIERATALLAASNGTICLYANARDDLEIVASRGIEMGVGTRLAIGEGMAGVVARTREPVLVEDYATWEHRSSKYTDIPFSAGVAVPMLYNGLLIGTLNLIEITGSTRTFNESDVRILTLFAGHAASAVHNTRLLAQSQQRLARLAALHEIDLAITSTLELTERLNLVLRHTRDQLRADVANVLLLDATGATLREAARLGVQSAPAWHDFTLRVGEGAAGWVATHSKPLAIPDVTQDARWLDLASSQIENITSFLGVPLSVDDRVIGVLSVSTRVRREFTQEEIGFLMTLAGQTAIAIQNARLFAETRQRFTELATLQQSSLIFSQLNEPAQVGQRIIETLEQWMPYERTSVWIVAESGRQLQLLAHSQMGLSPQEFQAELARVRALVVRPGEGISGWVALHGKPIRVGDVQRDPRYIVGNSAIQSELCVPLLASGRVIGSINVESRLANAFSEHDERLLTTLASQAAVALENARLFAETRQRLNELESVNRISTALRAAQTLDEMLPRLLDETLAVLGTDAGVIWLRDQMNGELRHAVARGWIDRMTKTPVPPGEGVAGKVVLTGEIYRAREFASDPHARASVRHEILPGWGGACVPIRAAREIVGVMFVAVALPRELTDAEARLLTTLAEIAGSAIQRTHLHEALEEAYVETVLALAKTMDARDSYTSDHSQDLAQMAIAVARAMGLSREDEETLRFAARLHDIGKIGVPDAILRKPGPLDPLEWAEMKKHPVVGAEIIQPVQRLQRVAPIVRHHQEKFDGTGYPDGLAGEAIPLGARILAVVDAFSAITDDRVYRRGRSRAEAIAEISRCAGTQFDPRIVEIFLAVIDQVE
ncbi:MAG: GAF domain-containing protein [Chloroflexi bacterium]|nr:GAF domain-containing protein [Chloroflexota bacterium]